MSRSRIVSAFAALALAAVALPLAAPAARAQEAVVGNLRLAADESGAPLEAEPAGPGEKVYRVESGTETLLVAFDYDGEGAMPVQIRVMAPQGVVIYQSSEVYDSPGTYVIEVDNGGLPFEDTEYVINSYVDEARYLADSMQVLIGAAEIIPPDIESNPPAVSTVEVVVGDQGALDGQVAPPEGAGTSPTTVDTAGDVPGPSPMLLVLAILGVIGLLGVVVWAGMSALRQS